MRGDTFATARQWSNKPTASTTGADDRRRGRTPGSPGNHWDTGCSCNFACAVALLLHYLSVASSPVRATPLNPEPSRSVRPLAPGRSGSLGPARRPPSSLSCTHPDHRGDDEPHRPVRKLKSHRWAACRLHAASTESEDWRGRLRTGAESRRTENRWRSSVWWRFACPVTLLA
jgi:hypothetical protein